MTDRPGSGPEKPETKVETQPTQPATPEVPKTDAEKAEAEKKAAAEKRDEGKEKVKSETRGQLGNFEGIAEGMLGGDFGLLMRRLRATFTTFLNKFPDLANKVGNIWMANSPEDVDKILSKSKDYKVPKIEDINKITTIENPTPDEKLVNYLYRCLKIPVPTAEQLHPEKELSIMHLMTQMERSFQFEKGPNDILEGFTQKPEKPEKFFKDDLVFFMNKMDREITAGFIEKIGDHTVDIVTINETGERSTVQKYKNMCIMAFHIPGNKPKGPVPIETKAEKKEEKKDDKKVDS